MNTEVLHQLPCYQLQQIFIRLDQGNGVKLLVNHDETVRELITRIRNSPLLLPQSFRLVYLGKQLKNLEKNLKELRVPNKAIIHIENVIPNSIRQVKIDVCIYYRDETTIVSTKTKDTIWGLKQKLAKKVNIPPKHQIIVFRGKQLQNKKSLEEYHIKSNSLLCLTSETDIIESETTNLPDLLTPTLDYENLISSVRGKERRNSKEMFRSEILQDRPGYEITIQQKDSSCDADSQEFGKDFNFEELCPHISELVIDKPHFMELDYSDNLNSSSSCSISLTRTPNLFKKDSTKMVFH